MNWIFLLFAGLLEVVWAASLKYTAGFTRLTPSIFTICAMAVSFYLLSLALKTISLGTGYAIWVGIGAVGTAIVGILLFEEPISTLKTLSLVLVVAGIVGLKLSSAV